MWQALSLILALLLIGSLLYGLRLWTIANRNAEAAERYQVVIDRLLVESRGTMHETTFALIEAELGSS